jgi:hypothetical protein
MPATQSDRRTGRRHRRIGITMLVAGVIVLVAAFAPTSANAQSPNSLVPAGPSTFTSSCTGNDAVDGGTTNILLNGVPGLTNPILLPTKLTTNGIEDPGDGASFTLDLTWEFTLPASVAGVAVSLGTTSLTQQGAALVLDATSGATGSSTGNPASQVVSLGDGTQDVPFQQATTATFTRAGTGTVVLTPGVSTTSSVTSLATLNLICTPQSVVPLTLNVQEGPPPPPTTAAVPPTLPIVATTTTAAAAPVVEATSTSGSTLARTGFHSELLYLGLALLGAGYAMSVMGRRRAKAIARSR